MSFVYVGKSTGVQDLSEQALNLLRTYGSTVQLRNLLWLSFPMVQKLGVNLVDAIRAMESDLIDEPLRRHLTEPPWTFLQWFKQEDASIYDTHFLLGGEDWRTSVMLRARLASSDHRSTLTRVDGNVVFIRPVRA